MSKMKTNRTKKSNRGIVDPVSLGVMGALAVLTIVGGILIWIGGKPQCPKDHIDMTKMADGTYVCEKCLYRYTPES